jgi:hypothetical protein
MKVCNTKYYLVALARAKPKITAAADATTAAVPPTRAIPRRPSKNKQSCQ